MIITVANQKGGQGKSTTAAAIAYGTAARGYKVLAIDIDPQANLTFAMGGDWSKTGSYEVMSGKVRAKSVIQSTGGCSLIPSNFNLAAADTDLKGRSRAYGLKSALEPIAKDYDLIVIDTPPTLGTLLINALVASDEVVIPMTADIWALQGLYQLVSTINDVRDEYNHGLKVAGVLFTRHNPRTIMTRDMVEAIQESCNGLGIPVFDVYISDAIAVRESQVQQQSLFTYAPKSKPAQEYAKLIDELGFTGKE